ncbi:MAG: tetratricopeptide repeat protein, partial [Rhodospirillales bacterium]
MPPIPMANIPDPLFDEALRHHRAGRLGEAGRLYDQLLAREPDHADALHLRGLVAFQSGREETGHTLVERAVSLDPCNAAYQANLGRIARELGHPEQAAAAFKASLAFHPDQAGLWADLAQVLISLERWDEAASAARKAIIRDEGLHGAWYGLGQAMASMGNFGEAAEALSKASACQGAGAATHGALGLVLARLKRPAEAAQAFARAVALEPNEAVYTFNEARARQDAGDLPLAEKLYFRCIQQRPGHGAAWNNLGVVRLSLGSFEDAADAFARALLADPDHSVARVNRSKALEALGRRDEALAELDVVLAEAPDDLDALLQRAALLTALGQPGEAASLLSPLADRCEGVDAAALQAALGAAEVAAGNEAAGEAAFQRALDIDTDCAEARLNRALVRLARGDWKSGFADFEARFAVERLRHRLPALGLPRWDGSPLPGRRLAILAEQGLGDSLQMLRFLAPLLKTLHGEATLRVQPALVPLLRGTPGLRVVGTDAAPETADAEMPLMSLAGHFLSRGADLGGQAAYLSAPKAVSALWQDRLASLTGPKIGLVWAGDPRHANDFNRSLPDAQILTSLNGLTDGHWISLQVGERGQEDAGLDRVVDSAIDFRSLPNYIFLPRWMMLALALKPRDV